MSRRHPGSVNGRRRLFADDYTSTMQTLWRSGDRGPVPPLGNGDNPFWARNYLGLLRFDALVSARLVIPDSHLFDGVCLLGIGARQLISELSRPSPGSIDGASELPFVVRCRAPSLADALRRLLIKPGDEFLNGFTFRSIPSPEAANRLAEALASRKVSDLERRYAKYRDPGSAVASLIKDCLRGAGYRDEADEWVGPMEMGWRQFMEESSVIPVERYEQNLSFSVGAMLKLEPIEAEGLMTRDGASAYQEIQSVIGAGTQNRSAITRILRSYTASVSDDDTREDLRNLDAWYSRGRYRAIAHQHQAAFVQLSDRKPFGSMQRFCDHLFRHETLNASRVELPAEILTGLADLPGADWTAYLSSNMRNLHSWWSKGEPGALQRAMDNLSNVIATDRSSDVVFGMVVPYSVSSALAGASAGFSAVEAGAPPSVAAVIGAATTATTAVVKTTSQPRKRIQRRLVETARATNS